MSDREKRLERALQRIVDETPANEHTKWHHHHWYLVTAREALADDGAGDNYGVCSKCEGPLIEYTTVGCPDCDNPRKSDDTPPQHRDALEALMRMHEHDDRRPNVHAVADMNDVYRHLTAPPTVPEALDIERLSRYFIHNLPDHLKPERGSSLQPYMDALERGRAQHSEPGRVPEGWISVNNRMPPIGQMVLITYKAGKGGKNRSGRSVQKAIWSGYGWVFLDHDGMEKVDSHVKAWMPCPKPYIGPAPAPDADEREDGL